MAIAFDNVGTGYDAGLNGDVNGTITINSNTNGILLAYILKSSNNGTVTAPLVYKSNNLTKIGVTVGDATNGVGGELWYLLNPPLGLGTLNGTMPVGMRYKSTLLLSYTGVDQSTPIGGSLAVTGSATTGSITTALSANQLFSGAMYISQNSTGTALGTISIGGQRGTISGGTLNLLTEGLSADSTGGTLQWNFNSSPFIALGAVLNQASAASSATLGYKTLLGIGQ